jgi:hypothetical protein
VAGFADKILAYFDRHLTQEDVRSFLVSEFQAILEVGPASMDGHPGLGRIGVLLANLGWVEKDAHHVPDEINTIIDLDAAFRWMEKLYGVPVISRNVVMTGVGENLEILDSQRTQESFVGSEAERLLRHVEYRRRRSLSEFSEDLDSQQIIKEKANLSIFFSRRAMRHNDLRYLNAAFKLNEWLMGAYRKMQGTELRTRFLLALAEQENTAQEMLR